MIQKRLGKEFIYLDGAMGTMLQDAGLVAGECPELWNIDRSDVLVNIHQRYFEAGSNIVLTNTFGANKIKMRGDKYSLKEIIEAAVNNAKKAAEIAEGDGERYVALDIGPTGKLLAPLGELLFEDAYRAFAEMITIGANAGVDLIHIETMSDTYEMKAAILAAKENCNLPIIATFTFGETGRLLTGADVKATVALLEGLGVNAYGINCGLGPKQMLPLVKEISKYSSLPLVVKANAGLPKQKDGEMIYEFTPVEFADDMAKLVECGVTTVGGCCGTNPDYIRELVTKCCQCKPSTIKEKDITLVSGYGAGVEVNNSSCIIDNRLDATKNMELQQALKERQYDYFIDEGLDARDDGADILSINVGVLGIDEEKVLENIVRDLQELISLPLQIGTTNVAAMEAALRIYNGRPLVSVARCNQEILDAMLPIIKKYGGVTI